MQSFVALRIKKALGIFRELIPKRRTRVGLVFLDPPSGSKKHHGNQLKVLTGEITVRTVGHSPSRRVLHCELVILCCCYYTATEAQNSVKSLK